MKKVILNSIALMLSPVLLYLLAVVFVGHFLRDFQIINFLSKCFSIVIMGIIIYHFNLSKLIIIKKINWGIFSLCILGTLIYSFVYLFVILEPPSIKAPFNVFRFISVVFLVPFFEEIIFRGMAIEYLNKNSISDRSAIILTSLIFGIIHLGLEMPTLFDLNFFIFGAILAYIYIKTRNLSYCIIIHMLYNLIAFRIFL